VPAVTGGGSGSGDATAAADTRAETEQPDAEQRERAGLRHGGRRRGWGDATRVPIAVISDRAGLFPPLFSKVTVKVPDPLVGLCGISTSSNR
jgi:hypothetical protein